MSTQYVHEVHSASKLLQKAALAQRRLRIKKECRERPKYACLYAKPVSEEQLAGETTLTGGLYVGSSNSSRCHWIPKLSLTTALHCRSHEASVDP